MFAPRNPVSTSLERNIVLGRILCCVSFSFGNLQGEGLVLGGNLQRSFCAMYSTARTE
jgi:hypothetical protein